MVLQLPKTDFSKVYLGMRKYSAESKDNEPEQVSAVVLSKLAR